VDEFVVCPSCGTRIKAGREFCLRCFEPLPTPERPVQPTIWVSLGLSDTKKQIVAVVAAALAVGLLAIILTTAPPAIDDTARPAASSIGARPNTPAQVPAVPQPAPAVAASARTVPIFEPTPGPRADAPSTPSTADIAALNSKRSADEAELIKRPDDAELQSDLGQVLERLGRPADAIPRFERAIALAPDKARFHSNLAHAAVQLGLWDRAVGEYREAVRLRPDDFTAQYSLALTLHRKGDDGAAIPEFQRAIVLNAGDASAYLSLGISLETVGRVTEAVQAYRRYLAIQPTSPDAERLKAHVQALEAGQP